MFSFFNSPGNGLYVKVYEDGTRIISFQPIPELGLTKNILEKHKKS